MQFGRVTVHLGEKSGKYPDGNQVVVTGTDSRIVFDTPLSSYHHPQRLEGSDAVILGHVHEDHVCALPHLPQAEVFVPQKDLAALQSLDGLMAHFGYSPPTERRMREHVVRNFNFQPRPNARSYSPEQVWELGGTRVRALPMPGHTGGHSLLLVEPEGVAFIGDIDLTGFGPYYGDHCSDLTQFRDSLERIEQVEAKVWVTSHHKGVITDRETFVAMLRDFKDKIRLREEAMLSAMGGEGATLEELTEHRFLFPRGYEGLFVDDAERITIMEHLGPLLSEGRIIKDDGRFRTLNPG